MKEMKIYLNKCRKRKLKLEMNLKLTLALQGEFINEI